MQKLSIFLPLLLLLSLPPTTAQTCQNNGTYNPQTQTCQCPPEYLGPACTILAVKLSPEQSQISLTTNFSFVYIEPQRVEMFRFVLTFCLQDYESVHDLYVLVYGQQEGDKGEIVAPISARQMMAINLGPGNRQCASIYSSVVASRARNDGGIGRIVFGVMKLGENDGNNVLRVKCEMESQFSGSFIAIILGSFIGTTIIVGLVTIILFLLRRRRQIRRTTQAQRSRLDKINLLMPIATYQPEFLTSAQNPDDEREKTCAICLCQFIAGEQIRKTPCSHIYHDSCLDEWCQEHFNCPVCRKSFEEQTQNQLEEIPQTFRIGVRRIRVGIL